MVWYDLEQSGESSILILSGTLKAEDVEDLERVLFNSANGTANLVIDLAHIDEISGPCREILFSLYKRLEKTGQPLRFIGKPAEEIMGIPA